MTANDQTAGWRPLGEALLDYHNGNTEARIIIASELWEDEPTPVSVFYRPTDDPLPDLEREVAKCQDDGDPTDDDTDGDGLPDYLDPDDDDDGIPTDQEDPNGNLDPLVLQRILVVFMERPMQFLGYRVAAKVVGERVARITQGIQLAASLGDQRVLVFLVLVLAHL